jgi:multidrug efflux pump subunit AcrA (membrane-fusion protein)
MRKKTLFITLGVVVVIVGVVAALFIRRANNVSYELATVKKGDIAQEVSASGKVKSPTKVNLQFKNRGEVTFLDAEVGQKVKAGEILARQDVSLPDAELQESQAVLETALTAPIDGFIIAVNSEVGDIAEPETIVVSIVSPDNLQIEVDIPETTIVNVKVGQPVKITLDAFDDETEWTGRVVGVNSVETMKGGAMYYKTTVFFDKEDTRIRSGMTANVLITTAASKDTLFVPASALSKKGNQDIVQVLQGKQVVDKKVVTGLENDAGMIEITSGLSQGEQVIIGEKK